MKISIYELLGMIKDSKAPMKIVYRNVEFEYESGLEDYFPIFNTDKFSHNGLFTYLFDEEVKRFLNDEVEILETTLNTKDMNVTTPSKKIEKLKDILRVDDLQPPYDCNLQKIWIQTIKNQNKINEIIDYINGE